MQRAGGESTYSEYSYIGQVNGCVLYSSWSGEEKSAQTFTKLGKRYSLMCKTDGFAYLTLNRSLQGVSVLLCNRKIEYSNAECQSNIFSQYFPCTPDFSLYRQRDISLEIRRENASSYLFSYDNTPMFYCTRTNP
ncbi:hypothetical protein [Buttiauxella gaviniae]|uniref:hypothetical protein n=1 Tax=Buttiauxella gaviniae TaxID=82990 RepID=UPI003C7361A0